MWHRMKSLIYTTFVDYEKAFHSPEMPLVMEALRSQEVAEAYVHVLANAYENSTAAFIFHEKREKNTA